MTSLGSEGEGNFLLLENGRGLTVTSTDPNRALLRRILKGYLCWLTIMYWTTGLRCTEWYIKQYADKSLMQGRMFFLAPNFDPKNAQINSGDQEWPEWLSPL